MNGLKFVKRRRGEIKSWILKLVVNFLILDTGPSYLPNPYMRIKTNHHLAAKLIKGLIAES